MAVLRGCCALAALALVMLVTAGHTSAEPLDQEKADHMKSQVEWRLKTRHLDWSGHPVAGVRPAWERVGRHDLLQTEHGEGQDPRAQDPRMKDPRMKDPQEPLEKEQDQEMMLEPVPPEVSELAAAVLLERHQEHAQDRVQEQGQGQLKQHQESQEELERLFKRLPGLKSLPGGVGDFIEF